MKSKQLFFFANKEDMLPVLSKIEELFNVRYYQTGLFDDDHPIVFESIMNAPDLGTVAYGDWALNKSYLMLQEEDGLCIRPVPQRKGGIKYAIDQYINQKSCILSPSGLYTDLVLVGGSVGSAYESTFSNTLIKEFQKCFKKEFDKIGNFYVGKVARQMLDSGFRLVTHVNSPIEYDLRIEK